MAIQLADAALIYPGTVHQSMAPPVTGRDIDPMADDDRLTVARGIGTAVLISAPLWALVAFTVYSLL